MAQHDYNIQNQSGANFRSDINNALSAIATTNRGSTEPAATFASQTWVDSATNKLKLRNASNTAWVELLPDVETLYGGLMQKIYPVGSIYINGFSTTNPATLLGFGVWVAYGAGKVFVGINASEVEFNELGESGGTKTHTLSVGEMPVHSHAITDPGHAHSTTVTRTPAGSGTDVSTVPTNGSSIGPQNYNSNANTTGITVSNQGGGGAHNNLQPYIVVCTWIRTG